MHTYMLLRLPQCQRIAVLIRHSCRMLLTPSFSDNLLFLSARLSASSSLFLSRRRCFQGLVPGLIGTTHGGFQFVAYEDLKKRFNRRANRHPEAQLVCAQHVLCACACVCVCLQELAACLLVSSLSSSSSFSASSLFIRQAAFAPHSACDRFATTSSLQTTLEYIACATTSKVFAGTITYPYQVSLLVRPLPCHSFFYSFGFWPNSCPRVRCTSLQRLPSLSSLSTLNLRPDT